ncbi:MAG: type III-B CRISPR module-associated protein Cmr5 [Methylococcales bacterium]
MIHSTRLLSELVFLKIRAVPENLRDDYGRFALKFPMLIRRNGLVQALRFARFRAEKDGKESGAGSRKFLEDFCSLRLGEDCLTPTLATFVSSGDAVEAIEKIALEPEYMEVTRVALRQAEWFKRFAQSVLGIDDHTGTDTKTEV